MQIPQIRMESQFAKIGIQTRAMKQSIQQPKADLQIKQPQAELKMRTIPGRLTIDQSQAWHEMDIKGIFQRVKENADRGSQKLMEGIGRTVREGDEMLEIQTGRNAYAEQAKRIANPPPPELVIQYVPSPLAVKFDYQPGRTDIQFQPKKPIIDAHIRKPEISYQRGDVNIYLQQRNSLKIDFVQ